MQSGKFELQLEDEDIFENEILTCNRLPTDPSKSCCKGSKRAEIVALCSRGIGFSVLTGRCCKLVHPNGQPTLANVLLAVG